MASYKSRLSTIEKSFTIRRSEPVLVVPAEPTPYELKPLSDLDDQDGLRYYVTGIQLYKCHPSKKDQDPARVIRDALAKALVYYYPIAGRLKEEAGRKLVVECTGEGVVFVEADADICVEDFGDAPGMQIPGADQLLHGPKTYGSKILDEPLLYVQVTRFKCGGFAFCHGICHAIADAQGLVQFLEAVAELARDSTCIPSVLPVWDRQLLSACSTPPKSPFVHLEYHEPEIPSDAPADIMVAMPVDQMINQSFFFGPKQLVALRKRLPEHLRDKATSFDLITSAVWQSRAIALDYPPELEVRLLFVISARGKGRFRQIPKGFYGNAIVFTVASATAGTLKESTYGYAVELVKQAKETAMSDEFLESTMQLLKERDRPYYAYTRSYSVTDMTKIGFDSIDFGWGGGKFGGPLTAFFAIESFFMRRRNEMGEEGMVVPLYLPDYAMERFVAQIQGLVKDPDFDDNRM